MRTNENRERHDRSHLRYPSDLTDFEWKLVESFDPARSGRFDDLTHSDHPREVVNGLMYILSTGCQRRAIPNRPAAALDVARPFDL